ncbi:MAG TPA: DUF2975 domain-containing protein [Sphingomonadaceae bacterium]|nr:DUF2975 domain-containing protein [Sphingomonadaceae bacterium]
MTHSAVILLRVLNVLNLVVGALFMIVLVTTFVAEPAVLGGLSRRFGAGASTILHDARLVMALSIATIPAAWLILTRLLAVLRTVESGDAFVAENGDRLRTMGWAMLAIQILDLGYGYLAVRVSESSGEYLGWSFSPGGWLAVLLVFVLARVWTQGAAMRDELDATV